MNQDEALEQLRRFAQLRAFGRPVGSDRLIQAGLDALLAGVDSPTLPLLAGLTRREEPEAQQLFGQVAEELGLAFEAPADPTAAKRALAYWLAGQITDGHLDPAVGVRMIWDEVAWDLHYPKELETLVHCAIALDDWDVNWGPSLEELKREALQAARELLRNRPSEVS
ncbi:hypothetical protein ACSNOK_20680 [Streptomyces sp. URMC 126]|uniref:hypothetical protein n=1 Tax=Streptomyces sp. URMC 126 TaxID=3423401 RepID=UPI003F1AA757